MFYFSQGPYSTFLGKTTTGTCLDFTFCRLEAGHYQVHMLYSTSAVLEGGGVSVMTYVPGLRCFPRLEKQDFDCSMYFTVLLQ